MNFHMRRGDHRIHDTFFQRAAGSALSSRLHENGRILMARNSGLPDANRIYGLLQRRQPPMQSFDFKNYSSFRNQEWAFTQHAAATRKMVVNDNGPAKGLVHEMIFRKDGKPTSHLSDVRDTIATNLTSSETTRAAGHRADGGRVGNIDWIGSTSRPLPRTLSAAVTPGSDQGDPLLLFRWRGAAVSNGYRYGGNTSTTSSDPVMVPEALGTGVEKRREPRAPTKTTDEMRIETETKTTKTLAVEKGWTPELQLSLSPNVGTAKKRNRIEKEIDSNGLPLSLSLSFLGGGDSGCNGDAGGDARRLETSIGSSSKKAALGLSTLDLTMSIKALE